MSAALRSLLLPLTPLYRLGLALRERRLASGREPIHRLQWPVISIGNLSTGGAGKTPLTIALAQALAARGFAVDVLSRGYGRRSKLPARVDPAGSPDDFGDEPLLIARAANVPVYVALQRYDAGLLAERYPAQPASAPRQVAGLLAKNSRSQVNAGSEGRGRGHGLSEKGTGFSPYIPSAAEKGALAPEG